MNLNEAFDSLRKRIYDLERNQERGSQKIRVTGTALGVVPPDSGGLTNPVSPTSAAFLAEVRIELDAAATADVTFDFLRSGSSIGSITCPTGDSQAVAFPGEAFTPGDVHRVQATDPGTGYTTFTVHELWETTREWWHPPVMMFGPPQGLTVEIEDAGEGGGSAVVGIPIDVPGGTTHVTFHVVADITAGPGNFAPSSDLVYFSVGSASVVGVSSDGGGTTHQDTTDDLGALPAGADTINLNWAVAGSSTGTITYTVSVVYT